MTAEAFTEFCLVGIQSENDASEVQYAGITEDITGIEFPEKDIEGMPLVNGGNVVKKTPSTTGTITLKVYPIGIANDGTGVGQFLAGTVDATDPFTVDLSLSRLRHKIVLVWAENLPATAGAVFATGNGDGYRITIVNAYCTSVKPSFDDKILSAEVTFKYAAFQKDASPNMKQESTFVGTLPIVTATPTSL